MIKILQVTGLGLSLLVILGYNMERSLRRLHVIYLLRSAELLATWEFLYYVYGEGPGLFFKILPDLYYFHFCRLVRAIQIIFQHLISQEEVATADKLLLQWVLDFEVIYCK